MTAQNKRQIALGAGVAVAIVLFALAIAPRPQPDTPPQVAKDAAPQAVEVAAPQTTPEASVQVPTPAQVKPRFDTFRNMPDGSALVAGRAEPGQVVEIRLGADPLGRTEASGDGSFALFLTITPNDAPRVLTLIADPDGAAILADDTFIVAPFAVPVVAADDPAPVPDEQTVADAAPPEEEIAPVAQVEEANAQTASSPDVDAPAPTAEDAASAAPEESVPPVTPDAVVAATQPAILASDAAGVRLVQPAIADASPEVMDNVALDTITYDPQGEVSLTGRAQSDGFVQLYLDNRPISTAQINDAGAWSLDLPEVDTGIYTLRIDEVTSEGAVISRIETPFKREEPADVAAVLAEETAAPGFEVAVKTVQPGATLWAIAQERFGNGIMYVAVFEANRDRIRDPDLIYPGQVFRLPEIPQ